MNTFLKSTYKTDFLMGFKNHEDYVQPSSENSACLRLHWYRSETHRYSEEQLQRGPVPRISALMVLRLAWSLSL